MIKPSGIEAVGLTKRYGDKTVVQDLTFTVRPGPITGFLGPNGAGKSTTISSSSPTPTVPRSRVTEVVELLTGLADVAHRRVKGFSLGMGQRLGIAAALLGDPATLILDEPVNGLDPEGVLWIRTLITGLADGGAYAAAKNPERATQALEAIGTTSRQALTELRRVLGVLHEGHPTADLAPQPTLADLDALVNGVREAGLPVRPAVTGPPAPLSPGRQLTVFRVVQESLTNTLKGSGATAEVTLAYGPDPRAVRTTDNGRGSRPAPKRCGWSTGTTRTSP